MTSVAQFSIDELLRRVTIAPKLPFFLPPPPSGSKASNITREYLFGLGQPAPPLPDFQIPGSLSPADDYFLATERTATGTLMWDVFKFQLPDTTLEIGPEFRMPDLTVVSFNQPKIIVKTPVNGRKGTVKELISDGDWQLRFFGFIVNYTADEYPIDQVREMKNMFRVGQSLKVSSKLCNDLGIYEIVCEEFSLDPVEESMVTARFELLCSSDEPIELEVQNV